MDSNILEHSKSEAPDSFLLKGFKYLTAGKIQSAITCFDRALEIFPEYIPAIQARALCKTILLPELSFEEQIVALTIDIPHDLRSAERLIKEFAEKHKRNNLI